MTLLLLKDFLRFVDLSSPRDNNLAALTIMVLYYKVVIEFLSRLRLRIGGGDIIAGVGGVGGSDYIGGSGISTSFTRELESATLSACVVFWPLFDNTHWTWRFNALVPAVMLARFFYKVIKF